MMKRISLTEAYKNRLAVSSEVYGRLHESAVLNIAQKEVIAKVLNNTSAYIKFRTGGINEGFSNSVGTQRADMGNWKKFTLDVTTVALPSLIANDLVAHVAMPSFTGSIQYYKFVAGSNKGGIKQGFEFNSPLALGDFNDARTNYTGQAVVDIVPASENAQLAWFPLVEGSTPRLIGAPSGAKIEVINAKAGTVKITGAEGNVRVAYLYDQTIIPQNDLPIYNAVIDRIGLEARPRRIAIYYSQMAEFQAQHENGVDLGKMLQQQAVAELELEIDTEVVTLLDKAAQTEDGVTFNAEPRYGISLADHYEAFAKTIEEACAVIFERTKKFSANYMVCSPMVKTMLPLMRGWKAANAKMNGPYFAGTLNGLKVFVSPSIAKDRFFVGYNGDDLLTSAAVLGTYMAIVPTALLQFADGGNSQGFSTLYDLKLTNPMLLVAGKVTHEKEVIETHANANA